jgi:lysophospholipase L1-like esterase
MEKKIAGYTIFKFFAGSFLVAQILLLIYTYYRDEIIWHGAQSEEYFKYYVISLLGIIFWSVVLQLGQKTREAIVTVSISLVVGLYMAEGILITLGLGQLNSKKIEAAAKLGVEFDERFGYEVLNDLLNEGVDAQFGGTRFLNLADMHKEGDTDLLLLNGGVSKTTSVGGNEGGQFAIYESDRHGFNNPDREWDSSKVEWLLIGDSFAHGITVQPGDDIAGQIRSITKSTTINLGIGDHGPLAELAILKEYAEALQPKNVLWLYYEGNDFNNLLREKEIPILMQYFQDNFSQNLIDHQEEIDRILKEHHAEVLAQMEITHKTRIARLHSLRNMISFATGSKKSPQIDYELFTKILTKAKDRVEAWGGKLNFIYLPAFSRYTETVDHDLYSNKSKVIELVKSLNIPVIDIHQKVFVDRPYLNFFPLRIGGHYNAKGYSEVAKTIVANIEN